MYRASQTVNGSPDLMEETKEGFNDDEEVESKPLRKDRVFLPAGTIGKHTKYC